MDLGSRFESLTTYAVGGGGITVAANNTIEASSSAVNLVQTLELTGLIFNIVLAAVSIGLVMFRGYIDYKKFQAKAD